MPQLPVIIVPPMIPPIGAAWKFAKKSQGRSPPNMMITPEARDSANAPDDVLLSVLFVDAICDIRSP
jgi:hypothetical protein